MSSDDNQFAAGESGALTTELKEAGRMKPGSLIMMKETFPCKVTAFSTAKPGKHGSAKAMITAKDIFTDKQYEETFGTGDMIPAPIVKKTELVCINLDEDQVQMLTDEGEMKEDLALPSEAHLADVKKKIQEILAAGKKECLVTFQKWGEKEQIVAVREGQDQ
jgi:translation initiation factor 5A